MLQDILSEDDYALFCEANKDEQNRILLKYAVKKWEGVLEGIESGTTWKNCALCVQYFNDLCDGCPVKAKTGKSNCRHTPYIAYKNNSEGEEWWEGENQELGKHYAEKELAFLKGLYDANINKTHG